MEILIPIILFIGGVVGGLYGAAVGSAGLIGVPMLILFGVPMHSIRATMVIPALLLELVSAFRYFKEKKFSVAITKNGLLIGIASAIGSVIGVKLILISSEQFLRSAFAVVILAMFLFLLTKNKWGMKEVARTNKHIVIMIIASLLFGVYGGYFGFAFGTLITLPLIMVGFTFLQSTIMARIAGAMMDLAALIYFLIIGHTIYYPYAIALTCGYVLGGWVGAGLGARKGNPYIKKLLTMIIVISALKLIIDFSIAF